MNDFLVKPGDDERSQNQQEPNLRKDETGSVPVLDSKKDKAKGVQKLLGAPKKGWHWIKFQHTKLNRTQKILVYGILLVLVFGGLAAGYQLWFKSRELPPEAPGQATAKPEPPPPTTEPSRLTGVEVPIDMNKRPVTGVMIENSPDARPQAGMKDAGVIFEAVAEGGITRFLVLYQEAQPDYIGPVRSARPYYLDWLLPFDASYAHVGGSPEALNRIRDLKVKDLDQFANAGAYQRVSNRYAPHNVYTSMGKLDELNQKKGYTGSTFTSFERKKEAAATVTAKSIDLTVSSFNYNPHYEYDAGTNSYPRSLGGKPHTDEKSGAQLSPKVVVALVTSRGIASDRVHSVYTATGSGKMYVFQDGTVWEGTWNKTDAKAQFTFKTNGNEPIKFNPGQTWFTMVNSASYKP